MAKTKNTRTQTMGEEIANSISHGMGFLFAIAVFPVLMVVTAEKGNAWNIVGASIFASSMVLLYLASMFFHALPKSRTKRLFQIFDHAAIYLLIAGTYTPFTLGVLRGAWGWTLFGIVWGLALVGIILKASVGVNRLTGLSTFVYLAMGWLLLIAGNQAWLLIPKWGLFWLLMGGIFYSAGVVFFVLEKIPYFHFIWHLFVLAGTVCHFVAILEYAC
ncbi:hemolysin III family protein [Desulfococcaceae bacterium OttesenSCG-928-F15]|nr:hemolysin III family protein [Desulfococcaceae bacterium OttesenSCG-928-F15]